MFARSNARASSTPCCALPRGGFGMNIAHEVDNLYTAYALVRPARRLPGARRRTGRPHAPSMVLRPVTPALPHIDMHIALAYKPQSESELVPLFVDVVREVVAQQAKPTMRLAPSEQVGRVLGPALLCLLRLSPSPP
jgi:hypothetical protein